jgi:hypothetical protein
MFTRFNVACALNQSTYWSIAVAKINLSRMDAQALIDLREQIEDALVSQRVTLERQLQALGGSNASLSGAIRRGGRGSTLKGTKGKGPGRLLAQQL